MWDIDSTALSGGPPQDFKPLEDEKVCLVKTL